MPTIASIIKNALSVPGLPDVTTLRGKARRAIGVQVIRKVTRQLGSEVTGSSLLKALQANKIGMRESEYYRILNAVRASSPAIDKQMALPTTKPMPRNVIPEATQNLSGRYQYRFTSGTFIDDTGERRTRWHSVVLDDLVSADEAGNMLVQQMLATPKYPGDMSAIENLQFAGMSERSPELFV